MNKRKSKYTDKKLAEKAALKAMSDYVRERDEWKCITCSHTGNKHNMDCGHFIPRGYSFWRFNERNNHCQCVKCNKYEGGAWPKYYDKMCGLYGKKFVEEMIAKKHILVKRTIAEYLLIEQYYKTKKEKLFKERKWK